MTQNLATLHRLKNNVGDRLSKILKDLKVVRNLFLAHEKRQRGMNRALLRTDTAFFEKLLQIDAD